MKILHVIVDLDVGGAELIVKRLTKSHGDLFGGEHIVVSLTDIGPVGQKMVDSGLQVVALGMRGIFDILPVFLKLTHLIRQYTPDIVQTWMYHADFIGGLTARFAGVKRVVWGIRSTDISLGGSKATLLIRYLCALFSHTIPNVIVCAAKVSRDAHVRVGYVDDKMMVIPNGFELSQLCASEEQGNALRSAYGISSSDRVIGSIGRFSPVKDHAVLIAAAAHLLVKHENLKVLLVGRELHSQNSALMSMINATPRPEAFVLLGERSDVASCLKAMDIFCLHSSTEGFPNVLGEAMAMGLPCVTTDVGDAAFLLGGHGLVVPSKDPESLAKALDTLLDRDSSSLASMGAAAQARIYSDFSMKRMTDRYHQLYTKLLDQPS